MYIKLEILEKFYDAEERSYYINPEIKKLWAVQLDLIAEISRICQKHNITWYLDAGSLLGAVRHKGFIPSDDAADIIMMRKDYDHFREVCRTELSEPYRLLTAEDHTTFLPHAKFAKLMNESTTMLEGYILDLMTRSPQMKKDLHQGIYIYIFPIENIPDDDVVYMPFEMLSLPVPSGWENILNQFYGSWKIPKVRTKHGVFYDTERPYTYYLREGHLDEVRI